MHLVAIPVKKLAFHGVIFDIWLYLPRYLSEKSLLLLTILVAKLSNMSKICPVRVLFHKVPLTCPTIHF